MSRMMIFCLLTFNLVLMNVEYAQAAKPKSSDAGQLAIMALRLPNPQRIDALKKQGPGALGSLKNLAFDESQTLAVRWRALVAMAMVQPKASQPWLEKSLKHDEWFMRNAGIVALGYSSKEKAIQWAQKLINDPALVVRTAAVQTLAKFEARESENLLWTKLEAKENFKNGQPLWIRKHIAKTLAGFARRGDEQKMIRILSDKDPSLHPFAIEALHRITNTPMQVKQKPLSDQRQAWLSWWKQNG